MTLRIPAKVLIHVWSYDFYDMTLSTGKQRRHMIKGYTFFSYFDPKHSLWVLVRTDKHRLYAIGVLKYINE